GGRCPTLLALRTTGAAAVGIDIAPTRTTVAACNLAGRVLEREEFETDHDFETTITRAVGVACRLIEKSQGKIEGIGVSLPGLVDPSTGRLLYVPYFKWRDLNVGPRIAAATGLDVTIDNDANAAALAKLWFGQSEVSETRDFIMVFIAEGVGTRSEEHTSELQSLAYLVCRLLLEKKNSSVRSISEAVKAMNGPCARAV